MKGAYDDGYRCCSCFWGTEPGSLVRRFLASGRDVCKTSVLDLGCGEGKNAIAFAAKGAKVTAVDHSLAALDNAQKTQKSGIEWVLADAYGFLLQAAERKANYDIVIMYGLLHCLSNAEEMADVVRHAGALTNKNGTHILATFNDGPHDLSAHPGFSPCLQPHSFFIGLYHTYRLLQVENEIIHEVHPHNRIPHHHSLTRILAEKAQ